VDSNATVDESALAATIAAAVVSSINGTGSVDWTHTVLDAANAPKANVWVAYYTDINRTVLAVQGYTDTQGEITFKLNPGTYYTKTVIAGYDIEKEVVTVA
jgi:hypothetical protein